MRTYALIVTLLFPAMLNHAWAMELTELSPQKKGLICTIDQENLHWTINLAWDSLRAARLFYETHGIYDNVYIVTGEDVRNADHMKTTWGRAFHDNDFVDYFSFVHGGNQWIKDAWQVPKDSCKIRVVYSEGCHGGSGKERFVEGYGACLSAGHDGDALSYSPFFSFRFLNAWLQGKSFSNAIRIAWAEGKENLKSNFGIFVTQKLIGSTYTIDEQIEGSTIYYSGRVDPETFSINSPWQAGEENVIFEKTVELESEAVKKI